MDIFECIMTRRSIKKFKEIPVEWEKVGKIIESGKAAPTAGNLQGWKFVVVTDQGARKAVAEACLQQYWMEKAAVHIIICSLPDRYKRFFGIRGERLYSIQDAGAVAQNMSLAAHAQGLASCWVGAFEEGMLKSALNIPPEARPQVVLPIGYPDEVVPAPAKYTVENVSFVGSYGNRIAWLDSYLGYTSQHFRAAAKKGKEMLKKIGDKLRKKEK